MSKLILVRHGESEYNAQGLWTGWHDPMLSPKGRKHAKAIAKAVKKYGITQAHTSDLKRAMDTWDIIHDHLTGGQKNIPTTAHHDLKERNYGQFGGKNKWQVKEEVGEEVFNQIRRSWDYQAPGGESLKDVYSRAVPHMENFILPQVANGEVVMAVTHGNTNRAFVKHLDKIADHEISQVEMPHELVLIYHFKDGLGIKKEEVTISL